MVDVIEREIMFRTLAGNPTARRIAKRAVEIEDEEEAKERQFPYMGWEWFDIPAQAGTLNQLVIDELLVTGGPRGTYRSRSSSTYKLKDPELVRECLESLAEIQEGAEEGEIPNDLFDFILGHDQVKDLLWKSINTERPVHVLLVGPPATSKSMFMGELARLPFSRFALGGSTRKGGFEDYLLEFRPKYVILDELDKMDMRDMSVLLSLMESGVVTRLKKRMREMEKLTTTVYAAANRDNNIWPELKSRFFIVHLKEYSEADFIQVCHGVLVGREGIDSKLADCIVESIASHTRDVREAVHLSRLSKSREDVKKLVRLRWPSSGLF